MRVELESGKKYVKSYINHICPNRDDCKCISNINFWEDGKMWRISNGKKKPVISQSEFMKGFVKIN
tara:strand:+ start:2902 stop:3099 length:198 start_codon:yes stop_codon:yes gene_type:complete